MLYEAEAGNLTLVAGGDTMITRRLSVFQEPTFLSLVELFRSADVGYANLEMLMHDFEHSPGISGGTFTGSDPANLKELQWVGIKPGFHCQQPQLRLRQRRRPDEYRAPQERRDRVRRHGTESQRGARARIPRHPRGQGRPVLATGEVVRVALDGMRRLSRPLGVDVTIEDGVGVIRP